MPINFNAPGAVGNAPYGNERTNAQGSPYLAASPTAMNAFSTSDLERAIFDTIFDTKPGNYFDSLKVLAFGKTPVSVPDDVYSWDESPMQRVFILVDDGASATGTVLTALQTAVANGYRTATIPVTAGQMGRVGINHNVMFTGGAQGVVESLAQGPTAKRSISANGQKTDLHIHQLLVLALHAQDHFVAGFLGCSTLAHEFHHRVTARRADRQFANTGGTGRTGLAIHKKPGTDDGGIPHPAVDLVRHAAGGA